MQPGAVVEVYAPTGSFCLEENSEKPVVLIAGGVGITPLYAMLQTMAIRQDVRPVYLFYGAADSESMTLKHELEALADILNLTLVPVLSDPEEGWEGETGYINAEIMGKYVPWQYKWFKYLICGPKPLMDVMEETLPALGIPAENVLTERFDMI